MAIGAAKRAKSGVGVSRYVRQLQLTRLSEAWQASGPDAQAEAGQISHKAATAGQTARLIVTAELPGC
jgi:hypothetical protein